MTDDDRPLLSESALARLDGMACPKCGHEPPTLRVVSRIYTEPLGTFSVAGQQMKVIGAALPTMVCGACDFALAGRNTADGKHVEFGGEATVAGRP